MKKRIAILGGGVAGITAAMTLARKTNCSVTLYEKADQLGGLIKDVKIDDKCYDIGAFIYSEDHYLFKLFPELRDLYIAIHHRPLSLRSESKTDLFPITIRGYIHNFGLFNFIFSIFDLILCKFIYRNYKTLDDYCHYYIGRTVYRKSGLKSYIQRLYGIDSQEIDLRFGKERMASLQHFSLRKLLKQTYFRTRLWKGGNSGSKQIFARPAEGFSLVFNYIEDQLKQAGVEVRKAAEIKELIPLGEQFLINTEDEKKTYDYVFSSLPVAITAKMLGISLPKRVFSSQHLLALFFTGEVQFSNNVIYNYGNNGSWKRIINFSQYYGQANGKDYFTAELPIEPKAASNVDSLIEAFQKDVAYFIKDLQLDGHQLVPFAYPVFLADTPYDQSHLLQAIQDEGIQLIGRQGTFSYLSSSETIRNVQQQVNQFIDQRFADQIKRTEPATHALH